MCTQVPVQIVARIDQSNVLVENNRGETKQVSLELCRCAKVGDYVTHTHGYVQRKFDPQEAKNAIATATKLMDIILSAPSASGPQQQFSFV